MKTATARSLAPIVAAIAIEQGRNVTPVPTPAPEPPKPAKAKLTPALLNPDADPEADKESFHREAIQAAFIGMTSYQSSLAGAIKSAIADGFDREDVEEWCMELVGVNGLTEQTIRENISRFFCAVGQRKNKKGQGRKSSDIAQQIADHIIRVSKSGEAVKNARAAMRILEKMAKAGADESDDAAE